MFNHLDRPSHQQRLLCILQLSFQLFKGLEAAEWLGSLLGGSMVVSFQRLAATAVPSVAMIFRWKRKLCWSRDLISTECLTPKAQTTQFQEADINHIHSPEQSHTSSREVVCVWFLTENQVVCHPARRSLAPDIQSLPRSNAMVLFDLLGDLFFLCQLLADSFDLLGHPLKSSNDGSWHQRHGRVFWLPSGYLT